MNKMAARVIRAVCKHRFPLDAGQWKLFFLLLAREAGLEEDGRFHQLMRMVSMDKDDTSCLNLLEQMLDDLQVAGTENRKQG